MNGNRKKQLGVIRICSVCHKVIDEQDTLARIEDYAKNNMGVKFSHGYCSKCFQLELAKAERKTDHHALPFETHL